MTIRYQCDTVSERGAVIGLVAGLGAFIGLAWLGYATGATWLAVIGFPFILISILAAQRRSTYDLGDDGVQVRDVKARGWAVLSEPGDRFVAFSDVSRAHIRFGKGRMVNNLVFRDRSGRRFAVTEDRLGGTYPEWRAFTAAFVAGAARHGLTVANADRL